ncbi:hypothetical protein B0I37DRAFT_207001 [Chaetomium sp. MPI-CAGE-AT-0009]|nr:hypothetical protein B0I37DRAFT_207001 [Chaetomium sp. MPI-CAGE-AT-0009]
MWHYFFIIIAWHGMAWHRVAWLWCGVVVLWHGIVNAEVSIKRNGPRKTRMQTGLKGLMMRLGSGSHYFVQCEASSGLGDFVIVVVAVAGLWLVVFWYGGAHLFFSPLLSRSWGRPWFFFFPSVCPALSLVLVPTEVRTGLVIMANGNGLA